MGLNQTTALPSPNELNALFLQMGADTILAQIKEYVHCRESYLLSQLKNNGIKYKTSLYNRIAHLDPDVFFNTFYSDYFCITNPFSCLSSYFSDLSLDANNQCGLLNLFYLLLYLKERFPNECIFFKYHRLQSYSKIAIIPSYKKLCDIWKAIFIAPYISKTFQGLDFGKVSDALIRLEMNSSYNKALIILYIVLYRDFRECERKQKIIGKLRNGFDQIEKFESPQAVFTYKNFDESKPRFLNKLFQNTFPENVLNSNQKDWKTDFSLILKTFRDFSLDFLIEYFIPEVFPSISTAISFLCCYPSIKGHSQDRKVIEIICAYLYSIESKESDKVNVFKDYLDNKIYRDGLTQYREIFDQLNKLQESYAVIGHISDSKYKRSYEIVKPTFFNSSKPKSSKEALLDFYLDNHENIERDTKKLTEIPALDFLIENQNNCKDCKVENGIIFEEIANCVMLTDLRKVVLLQPSYSFLLNWLTDYRTKNLETTVVIYDESIVDCLNQKLAECKLVSKKLYYTNQKTSYHLHIVSSIDNLSEFDLGLSFYNKDKPKYEDLVSLSKALSDHNRLLCVLPYKFFGTDDGKDCRREMVSSAKIKKVTCFDTILFGYSPKKKYLVEFVKKEKTSQINDIPLRVFKTENNSQEGRGSQKNGKSGIDYINFPDELMLKRNSQYDGEAIDFLNACSKQGSTEEKKNYNRAQKVSIAPDFNVYYNVTNHGKGKQAKCFFAKYLSPIKNASSKKGYGAKIAESTVTISAKDDAGLERKIVEDFPFSDKFEKLRAEAAKEILSALSQGRIRNISLFSFCFSYSDSIKNNTKGFDCKFCFNAFYKTSLGSLVLNKATQEDFDKAISDLTASTKIDSEKLFRQLEIVLKYALNSTVLSKKNTPIFEYIETKKKQIQTKAQLRDAFTKKTLSFEEEKELINWLLNHYSEKPAYLGTMIKLLTGMTNPEVCMLTWGDFCKTEYCDCYHFNVTKQRNYKTKEPEDLSSPFRYRVVPIPSFLSDILIAQREKLQKKYRIPFETLMDISIITDSNDNFMDYCSPNKLHLNSNKALREGAKIPEHLLSFPDSDGRKKHDLNKYNGDFFVSNFKFHALNDAMMTQGEVSYILGLVPHDTFSKHYCDYTNPFLQMKLVAKLNDWCSLYYDWNGAPQIESGTTQSDLKSKNIIISPYNSGCASGLLELIVKRKSSAAIEIEIAGNRGIKGSLTTYEVKKHGK